MLAVSKKPAWWCGEVRDVIAIPLGSEVWGYICRLALSVHVYPMLTEGGIIPVKHFGPHNWRWMISGIWTLPRDAIVIGKMEASSDDLHQPKHCEILGDGTVLIHRPSIMHSDGWIRAAGVELPTPNLAKVIGEEVPVVHEIDDVRLFIWERARQMLKLDLKDLQISVPENLAPVHNEESALSSESIIEVWMAPDLEEPEQTFEDFILDTLMETELGVVGEYADMKDYRFASCDVSDPAKAARALLKAFKKAGYTTGIEIKERDGKQRVWKLG